MDQIKKKIHFILPGGGVRGSFQAGFLYRLANKYTYLYSIYHIDGTSVGAINGFAFINNKTDMMKKFWFNIKSPESIISPIIDISPLPFVSDLVQLYNSVWGKGVFSLRILHNKINEIPIPSYGSHEREHLNKFHCTAVNIDSGKLCYIGGNESMIKKFICASSSLWIISEPIKIGENNYIDGGLLEHYPTKCIKKSNADLIVLVGYDNDKSFTKNKVKDSNMLKYLDNLIDLLRKKLSKQSLKRCKKYKVILIPNNFKGVDSMNLNREIIIKGFADGELAAEKFVKQYLKDNF